MTDDQATALPGPVQAELTRLRAERDVFLQQREQMEVQLREAEIQLREVEKHRDELLKASEEISTLTERSAQADRLADDLTTVRAERDTLRDELVDNRTERDRLRLQLLDAETLISSVTNPEEQLPPEHGAADRVTAERQAAHLASELAATRRTVSWRITAPLRAARRKAARR